MPPVDRRRIRSFALAIAIVQTPRRMGVEKIDGLTPLRNVPFKRAFRVADERVDREEDIA